jgi:hypothetical protein
MSFFYIVQDGAVACWRRHGRMMLVEAEVDEALADSASIFGVPRRETK